MPASSDHLAALPEIERAAGRMFEGWDVPEQVMLDMTPAEEFRGACEDRQLFVALTTDGEAGGFALVHEHEGEAHLEELGVHPDHGRRGIGAQLVRSVCDLASEKGLPAVTLTTFRDVPWNEPFYRRLGFAAIPDIELSPALHNIVEEEAERGLDPARRVVMRRSIA